ncbi:MAG TPA: HlyD family type I secretion periplasmic adaptor subunit [Rhizomicrobium sp.]|jgi:HlyD family type I secretion membrane fusion protein
MKAPAATFADELRLIARRWRDVLLGSDRPSAGDGALPFLHTDRVITRGVIVLAAFFLGFFGWAAVAPLQSALLAPGVIVVESHRKTIQHLEGGIVKDIRAADGQMVKAGQVLMVLDDTQARAALALIQDESDGLAAQEARLIAEREDADSISFPAALLARQSDPKVAQDLAGEVKTFDTKRASLQQQIAILGARKNENARVIDGLRAQGMALQTQIALLQREQDNVQQMVDKGLEPLPRLLALQRQGADLGGQRGQLSEKISQVEVSDGETDLQIVNLKNQMLDDALKDLRDVQSRRFDLLDRMQAARDVLDRTIITAPVGGEIVNLTQHTKGAVIKPGDTLMEIVPRNDKLEVEARVRPEDADQVFIGMKAKVNLSGYAQRRLPMITGVVTYIAPDRQTDSRTGHAYFTADVSVDRKMLRDFPEARLIPGEPAQVAIQTGTRTALEYFVEPIRDVLRNGMRER